MGSFPIANVIVTWLGFALIFVGIRVVRAGWWPKRMGDEPRCGRCEYSLIGIAHDRCPECGSALVEGAVVRGERIRRRRLVGTGLALAIPGLLILLGLAGGFFRNVNWYQYWPTDWLITHLGSSHPPQHGFRAREAWAELDRRSTASLLTDRQEQSLDGAAIDRLGRSEDYFGGSVVSDALARRLRQRWAAGVLAPPEQDRLVKILLSDLAVPTKASTARAESTLEALMDSGALTPAHQGTFVEAALRQQATRGPEWPNGWMMDRLGQLELAGTLDARQRETFFAQAASAALSVRPRAAIGEHPAYRIRINGRGPPKGWWVSYHLLQERIDGEVVEGSGHARENTCSAITDWDDDHVLATAVTSPGAHRLELDLVLRVHAGPYGFGNSRWEHKLTLAGSFEAVEGDAGVTLVDDPALSDFQRERMTVKRIDYHEFGAARHRLRADVGIGQGPFDVAFDVIARWGGREHLIGSIWRGGRSRNGFVTSATPVADIPSKVDVILRSSAPAARKTVDIQMIWQGELVYHDVPVSRAR